MKITGRRQSDNVHIQTEKENAKAKTGLKLQDKVMNNPRTLVNEPIEFNEDRSNEDRMRAAVGNPGRPRPDVSLKTQQRRANDGKSPVTKDAKFFKHDIKDN